MTLQQIRSPRFAIVLVAAVLCFASIAQAGPPLICHTIEIGQAKSLPWIGHNWNLSGGENYDTKNLVRDTLDILTPDTPVLVRMETLRRATLYARKDPLAAKELLARLHARATSAGSSGHSDALVKKALALRGSDPQMEFAAALITLSGPQEEHRQHALKAIAGAKTDPLLAQNLATHFIGPQSQTMSDMLAKELNLKLAKN